MGEGGMGDGLGVRAARAQKRSHLLVVLVFALLVVEFIAAILVVAFVICGDEGGERRQGDAREMPGRRQGDARETPGRLTGQG